MKCSRPNCQNKALPNRKQCNDCRLMNSKGNKQKTQLLREQGLCITCRCPSQLTSRCPTCSLKGSLAKSKVQVPIAALKQLLVDQDNRCGYTGLPLELGKNASLDHIHPRAKGGSDDIQNLHWVESSVNRMKGDKSHSEFLDFIEVLRYNLSDSSSH